MHRGRPGRQPRRRPAVKLIFHSMRVYAARIAQSMFIKFLGAVTELLIPFILEHLIDEWCPWAGWTRCCCGVC